MSQVVNPYFIANLVIFSSFFTVLSVSLTFLSIF